MNEWKERIIEVTGDKETVKRIHDIINNKLNEVKELPFENEVWYDGIGNKLGIKLGNKSKKGYIDIITDMIELKDNKAMFRARTSSARKKLSLFNILAQNYKISYKEI